MKRSCCTVLICFMLIGLDQSDSNGFCEKCPVINTMKLCNDSMALLFQSASTSVTGESNKMSG